MRINHDNRATFRNYDPVQDFLPIRDFLVNTWRAFGKQYNWRLERWNYARYFVVPFLGTYRQKNPNPEDGRQAISFWERIIGVWENEQRDIVGVVTAEYAELGHAFMQQHPQHPSLLAEMLDYAENTLIDKKKNMLRIHIYEHDKPFQSLACARGYQKDVEHPEYDSEFVVGHLPEPQLPDGYRVRSMAEENNLKLRCQVVGRGFNHTDPTEWPSIFSYQELQKAPDYRKDLDLFIVDPDDTYAACCIAWYDEKNKMGILEPVATHPDFRGRGLGKEVVMEGVRRLAMRGAERVWVGSGQRFYEAIGFTKKYVNYPWTKKF